MNNDQKVFLGGLIMGSSVILSIFSLKNAIGNTIKSFKHLK